MPDIPYNKTRPLTPLKKTFRASDGAVLQANAGWQMTATEGRPWLSKPRPEGDIGGEFATVKLEIVPGSFRDVNTIAKNQFTNKFHWLSGPVFPFNPNFAMDTMRTDATTPSGVEDRFDLDVCSSDSQLRNWGTVAVDRVSPVNSIASVATTLGELRNEGLPALVGMQLHKNRPPRNPSVADAQKTAQSAGSEFLNWQFGIAPLLGDLDNFVKAVSQSGKILRQLERDSGRVVRRRYRFPLESETVRLNPVNSQQWPTLPSSATPTSDIGVRSTNIVIKRERWFSGAFTYYLPNGGSTFDRVARGYLEAEKLFGTSPDLETIWNLTPWSWASDWAFNTGSVLANLTDAAQYGLVMPYGYIMETTTSEYQTVNVGPSYYGVPGNAWPLTVRRTVKKRLRASPFGFGLTWDGLDTVQKAILVALGITRQGRR